MIDPRLVKPRTDPVLPPSADPLSEVLQLLQLTGVLYCNAELTDPWGIEVPALPGVMYVEVVTSGHCWLELDGETPVFMPQGSLVLIARGRRHKLRGNPGDRTTRLEDIPVERIGERFEIMRFGGGGRSTRVTYYGVRFDPYLADRLIRLLPEILQLRTHDDDGSWLHGTIRFIAQEARQRLPGSETMITRLADILVIQAIRTWIESVREEDAWLDRRAARPPDRQGDVADASPTRARLARGHHSRAKSACRARDSRRVLPRWWANRYYSISPGCACSSHTASCARPRTPWPKSPNASATSRNRHSTAPSSASWACRRVPCANCMRGSRGD